MTLEKQNILGVEITSTSKEEILKYVIETLKNNNKKYYITTPNPEMIVRARSDNRFREILNESEIALPDGIGIVYASKFKAKSVSSRLTGVDFMLDLIKHIDDYNRTGPKKPITIGLLGGKVGIAERTADCLQKTYHSLVIKYASGTWDSGKVIKKGDFFRSSEFRQESTDKNTSKESKSAQLVDHNNSIDIIFVAFGFPKQEIWMSENLKNLPVKVMMGVGGSFDFISGSISRAPIWIQNIGLEWLYRLIRQPWRIKRQMALLKFIYLVILDRLGLNNS